MMYTSKTSLHSRGCQSGEKPEDCWYIKKPTTTNPQNPQNPTMRKRSSYTAAKPVLKHSGSFVSCSRVSLRPWLLCKAPGPGSAHRTARWLLSHRTRDVSDPIAAGSKGKYVTPSYFFSTFFCTPLENRVSLCKASCSCHRNDILGIACLGCVCPPLQCLESIFGLPCKFQVSFIKYLTGIFFSLSHCSFNITFDILSFTDGKRSRTGELKIACQGDRRLEIGS